MSLTAPALSATVKSPLDLIGKTPMVEVTKIDTGKCRLFLKLEAQNPGGSIKDRIALAMIEAAEASGDLKPGGTIIEPTSGNTGVGLAMVAAVKGYKLILVMPESMSIERRRLMLAYGASFDLTPREKGMKGAIERARELIEATPGSWMPQQFENGANVDVHVRTTAQEILNDFRDSPIDVMAPVAEALADELQLHLPEQPWHTQRDRLVEFASLLGLIAGSLGKLGRDLSLLMQTEAGEVFEPSAPGKGGSSTMPHKRNPVGAAVLIGAATRAPGLVATMLAAMPQEHERSLGLWHAEWETLPELCCLVSGALQQALLAVPGLEVDAARMRANLELTQGLVLAEAVSIALAQRIGRDAAHHLVEQCCRQAVQQGVHLRAVLGANAEVSAELSATELERLLDPAHYLGQARRWVQRAVAEHTQFSR